MQPLNHDNCLLCGKDNPYSLGLSFRANEDGSVVTTFRGNEFLQGYNGILHGGVISSLLDSAMTNCLFNRNILAMTGELVVRFRHPVPMDSKIGLRARLISTAPPLYRMRAEIFENNKVLAWAKAKFIDSKE